MSNQCVLPMAAYASSCTMTTNQNASACTRASSARADECTRSNEPFPIALSRSAVRATTTTDESCCSCYSGACSPPVVMTTESLLLQDDDCTLPSLSTHSMNLKMPAIIQAHTSSFDSEMMEEDDSLCSPKMNPKLSFFAAPPPQQQRLLDTPDFARKDHQEDGDYQTPPKLVGPPLELARENNAPRRLPLRADIFRSRTQDSSPVPCTPRDPGIFRSVPQSRPSIFRSAPREATIFRSTLVCEPGQQELETEGSVDQFQTLASPADDTTGFCPISFDDDECEGCTLSAPQLPSMDSDDDDDITMDDLKRIASRIVCKPSRKSMQEFASLFPHLIGE